MENALSQPEAFGLSPAEAGTIAGEVLATVKGHWRMENEGAGVLEGKIRLLEEAYRLALSPMGARHMGAARRARPGAAAEETRKKQGFPSGNPCFLFRASVAGRRCLPGRAGSRRAPSPCRLRFQRREDRRKPTRPSRPENMSRKDAGVGVGMLATMKSS